MKTVGDMNIIVPVTIVQEFIKKAEVKPEISHILLAYENAYYFNKAWYKKVLAKFKEVKGMNNSFTFVDKFIEETKNSISKGLDIETKGIDLMYYYMWRYIVPETDFLFLAFRERKR